MSKSKLWKAKIMLMKKGITHQEVADSIGVARCTVTRVLGGHPDISPRVCAWIKENLGIEV